MDLEQQELLKGVVPALARRFGSTKERAWELLQNQNCSLNQLLSQSTNPKTRQRVNKWWKRYHADFPMLGLGILRGVQSPAKLPEPTYNQLICLVWLKDALRSEQLVREWKRRAELVKPQLTFWQRISRWLQNLLRRK